MRSLRVLALVSAPQAQNNSLTLVVSSELYSGTSYRALHRGIEAPRKFLMICLDGGPPQKACQFMSCI